MLQKHKRIALGIGAAVGTAGIVTAIAVPLALKNKDEDKSSVITIDLTSAEAAQVKTAAAAVAHAAGLTGAVVTSVTTTLTDTTIAGTTTTTSVRRKRAAAPVQRFVLTLSKEGVALSSKITKVDGTIVDAMSLILNANALKTASKSLASVSTIYSYKKSNALPTKVDALAKGTDSSANATAQIAAESNQKTATVKQNDAASDYANADTTEKVAAAIKLMNTANAEMNTANAEMKTANGTGATQLPVTTNPGGTTTGGTATPITKYSYAGTDYDTLDEAKAAVDAAHVITPQKVFIVTGVPGTEYATEDLAKDQYVSLNAGTRIETRPTAANPDGLTDAGAPEGGFTKAGAVTNYWVFGGNAYLSADAAKAAWLATLTGADLTKTQGVDTVTYAAAGGVTGVQLTTTTQELTRDSATASTAPTITFGAGVLSGTNGVTGVAGTPVPATFPAAPTDKTTFTVDSKTYTFKAGVKEVIANPGTAGNSAGWFTADEITTFGTYKDAAYDPGTTPTIPDSAADGTKITIGTVEYTYKGEVPHVDGDATTGTAGNSAGWFTDAEISGFTTYQTNAYAQTAAIPTNPTAGTTIVIGGITYTYKAAVTHVNEAKGVPAVAEGWYDETGIVSTPPTIYKKADGSFTTTASAAADVKGHVDAVENSQVKTYPIMVGTTQIGSIVVQSPQFGHEAPTISFTDPTAAAISVTVAEKTAYEAKTIADAPADIDTSHQTTGTVSAGGSTSAAGLPAATTKNVYVFGSMAYKELNDAKAALKASITNEVSQVDSKTKVLAGGKPYPTADDAYKALITSKQVTVSSAQALELIYSI